MSRCRWLSIGYQALRFRQTRRPTLPLVWPPEIDFPLIYTDVSSVQWMKIQVSEREGKTQSYTRSTNDGFDASVMHTYGVDWQANFITFYVDGAQVFRVPTPTDGSYTHE